MTQSPPAVTPSDEISFGGLFRRFLHTLTLLFCLFLVVRTTFVEPHGVPTGSMATTISGNHRQCPCPRCGASVVVGSPAEEARGNPQLAAYCPNCGLSKINLVPLSDEIFGDRLLVDRMVFRVRSPRRWEVAVFHPPEYSTIPYVKRVVGLPGESIRIFDGDAYANGELLRKPLEAIREMAVPIFAMDHLPQPMGWTSRWTVESMATSKLPSTGGAKSPIAIETIVRETRLILDATSAADSILGVSYRQRNLDTQVDELIRDDLAYNGSRGVPKPVHDFIADCEIEVVGGAGTMSIRLGDGSETVRLDIPVGGTNLASLSHDGGTIPIHYPLRFETGRRYRVELAFVDRRAFVAIEGQVLGSPLEIAVPQLGTAQNPNALSAERRGTASPFQFEVRGVSVVLQHLKLSRDVHYRSEGDHAITAPCVLGPTDYFLLGDNSAASEDARAWKKPGVPECDFIGKPFLVHQPLRIGRLSLNGNEHRFQTIDWDRFRLLR